MSKHTKEWLRNGGPYEIWAASGYQIADFHVSACLSDDECEANARLAAAAPKLLAALKDARERMMGGSPAIRALIEKTDAALAEAEDRT